MSECTHCGRELPYDRQCWECGDPFCHAHEQPLMHDCPGLEELGEECAVCGTRIRDPHTCSGCGRPLCPEHTRRDRHDCPALDQSAVAATSKPLSEVGADEGSGLLSRVIPGR